MSCEERKHCILNAVRKVFSRKGLEGATTRELAKEAGISEALLFRHFESKEKLHQAMLEFTGKEWMGQLRAKIDALEPSTSTLVITVYFLASALLGKHPEEMDGYLRLYVRSLATDGEFARTLVKTVISPKISKLRQSIEAAVAAGDIETTKGKPAVQAWFVDRLILSVMLDFLPANPVMEYGVTREALIEQAVLFALRGIGLKSEAIRRYYDAKAFALLGAA